MLTIDTTKWTVKKTSHDYPMGRTYNITIGIITIEELEQLEEETENNMEELYYV